MNKPSNIAHSFVLPLTLSDHYLIYVSRKLGNESYIPKVCTKISYLDLKNFSAESFQQDLQETYWQNVYNSSSCDSMLEIFNLKLTSIISNHLKQKSRFVKSNIIPPRLDFEVQANLRKRDRLKRLGLRKEYKHQRNYTTNLMQK